MSDLIRIAIDAVEHGRLSEAVQMLSHAAQVDDPEAAYALAGWRMTGDLIRRDLSEARRLYGIAAKSHYKDSENIYLALLANGAGNAKRHWQEALEYMREHASHRYRNECKLLEAMDIDLNGDPKTTYNAVTNFSEPEMLTVRNFLSSAECSYLIALAQPRLQPSLVVDPNTGSLVKDPIRNSSAVAFPFVRENPVIHALNRRIAHVTNTTYEQGEPAQVLAYDVNQEYRPHSDALPNPVNQRILTVLVYLNENFRGGETRFQSIDWSFKGNQGDALLFRNTDARGNPHPLAVHAGAMVEEGRKFLLSKWIREAPLDLSGPPGRPF